MFGSVLARLLNAHTSSRAVWRRVIRFGEPLEHRQLLSAGGLFGDMAALPAAHASPLVTSPIPYGDTPAQIRNAYGFNQVTFTSGSSTITGNGSGQTIAIVDAYGDSKIVGDIHAFDAQFGLPDPNLTVVNQNGGATLPRNNSGWALETALDVEWAHAMAPNASLLLVEASNSSLGNLLAAVNYARNQPGVVAVSMSWGAGEFPNETSYDSYFTTPAGHQGVTFVAASGDNGAGTIWPAASPNVLSTGGTTLNIDSSGNYLGETAWSGSGGGLSLYESQPTYQSQSGLVTQSATQRATPDVSYDADPASGVAVYDSISYAGQSGWFQVGGTSAAAPQMAALVAVADQGRQIANGGTPNALPNAQASLYSLAANSTSYSNDFHDVTSGSNGSGPLASAAAGFDLVTGLGTPKADALVHSLVTAQATTVVSTAGTDSKTGSGSTDPTLSPSALAEIIIILSPQPVLATSTVVPLVTTPGSNLSTPAVSVALPSAEPVQFSVNSLLVDDPVPVPLKPGRPASQPALAPPAGVSAPTLHRDAVHDDVLSQLGKSLLSEDWSFLSRADAAAACDACFADTAFTDTFGALGEAAADLTPAVHQAAALAGLLAVAALVDRRNHVGPDRRQQPALPRR